LYEAYHTQAHEEVDGEDDEYDAQNHKPAIEPVCRLSGEPRLGKQ
jgi:hypothetical protein